MKKRLILLTMLATFFVAVFGSVQATELTDDGAIISSSVVIQTKTGTGPFDADDEAGNDSSEDNNIVRSFDQVTWTVENTMVLNTQDETSFTGGKIYFEATLPDCFTSETATWDTDSMNWIEDLEISSDGLTITGYYEMDSSSLTIPGKQSLVLVAKILGAANGTTFKPTVTVWLQGNTDDEKVVTGGFEDTIVSAAPNYNIRLARNTNWGTERVTVNYDGEDHTGRMYGYSFVLQLYNTDTEKGLKGIEYPSGDITFDIEYLLTKSDLGSSDLTDITDDAEIILWDYQVISNSTTGILGRNMKFNSPDSYSGTAVNGPWGILRSNRESCVYNSGNVSMIQKGNAFEVTISDYEFDGIFPVYNNGYLTTSSIVYTENIGCFSSIYFQVFVPENAATEDGDKNYYLTLSDTNFNATSISGTKVTTQQITTDDSDTTTHVRYKAGSYEQDMWAFKGNTATRLSTNYDTADGVLTIGEEFNIRVGIRISPTNESGTEPYTVDKFFKFDGEAFELRKYNGSYFSVSSDLDPMTFKMYFVTKKDGTNWASESERNEALIENMNIYENIEDVPDGYLIVGCFFESQNGYVKIPSGYGSQYITVYLKVKDTANVNSTYGFTQASRYWLEELDRDVYSQSVVNGFDSYPDTVWQALQRNYIQLQYDEDGNTVSGTHSGGYTYGTTVLIIGAEQKIEISTVDETDEEKVNYDFSKNEYDVTYKVQPILSTTSSVTTEITDIAVDIMVTLPEGLTYVAGSCELGEPELVNNSDGTTTLTWTITGCTVDEAIDPLYFTAHIDENSSNGTQYSVSAVIKAEPDRIGTTGISKRTTSTSIQVINLASHRLYKTVSTPVIEKNGEIHYTVSYKNNTESSISEFQLLDILPYNSDSRGTSYTGTYTLDKIVVTQTNSNGDTLSNDNLTILYTNDDSARNESCKADNLGDGWTEILTSTVNDYATAFVVKGEVAGLATVTIDIYLKTSNNSGLDKYVNSSTAQVYSATEEMTTGNVTAQVVERKIEGVVWLDSNANGVMDEDEETISDTEVTLTDENGAQVTDVDGNIVSSVKTDEDGYYSFSDLPQGNYYVKITLGDSKYILTQKEVGANSEVNSKFNTDTSETDEITKLNSIDLPELTVSYVNAGVLTKETQVVVNYMDIDTEEELYDEITIDGRVDDEYETEDKIDEINQKFDNKYELVKTTENTDGTMTEDTIYVTYYYSKKETSVIVKYIDIDTNDELYNETSISGRIDDEYTTVNELDNINLNNDDKYEFVSSTDNTEGIMTEDEIEVIYYYQKKTGEIEVNYLEVGTESVLSGKVTSSGKVDSEYTTENKLNEINKSYDNKYEFVETTGADVTGVYTLNKQTITYWYQKKETGVVVKYIDIDTNNELYDEATISGRIDDEYTTVNELDNINLNNDDKYEFVSSTDNTEGIMTEDEIEVIYYYQKKTGEIEVNYLEVGTESVLSGQITSTGKVDSEYTTENKLDEINDSYDNKYEFVETTGADTEGVYTLDKQTITYWYQKKETSVVVKYVDIDTNDELYDEATITGRIDDEYTTVNELDNINEIYDNKYEFVSSTDNTEGTMTEDEIEVIYYYQKKTGEIEVNYLEVGTESVLSSQVTSSGKVDSEYTTENKLDEINDSYDNKYEFVETTGASAEGVYTLDKQTITYWYQKKETSVVVKYVDIDTEEELYDEITITGRIDDEYTTEDKVEEINENSNNKYVLVETTENTSGTMQEDQIEIIYYYQKVEGQVVVKYVDEETGEEIIASDYLGGYIGDEYTTSSKEIDGYILVEEKLPENSTGEYGEDTIYVIYYYSKVVENTDTSDIQVMLLMLICIISVTGIVLRFRKINN